MSAWPLAQGQTLQVSDKLLHSVCLGPTGVQGLRVQAPPLYEASELSASVRMVLSSRGVRKATLLHGEG